MGTSTNAYIAYGIDLDEDVDFLDEKYGDDWKWSLDDGRVEVITHCSGEYPLYIVAVPGSVKSAYRGSPTRINPDVEFNISDYDVERFLEWCNENGVEAKPQWFLFSYWG